MAIQAPNLRDTTITLLPQVARLEARWDERMNTHIYSAEENRDIKREMLQEKAALKFKLPQPLSERTIHISYGVLGMGVAAWELEAYFPGVIDIAIACFLIFSFIQGAQQKRLHAAQRSKENIARLDVLVNEINLCDQNLSNQAVKYYRAFTDPHVIAEVGRRLREENKASS